GVEPSALSGRGTTAVADVGAASCGGCCAWGPATRMTMRKPANADRKRFARPFIEVLLQNVPKRNDYRMTSVARLSPRMISTLGSAAVAGAVTVTVCTAFFADLPAPAGFSAILTVCTAPSSPAVL